MMFKFIVVSVTKGGGDIFQHYKQFQNFSKKYCSQHYVLHYHC